MENEMNLTSLWLKATNVLIKIVTDVYYKIIFFCNDINLHKSKSKYFSFLRLSPREKKILSSSEFILHVLLDLFY